jgi:hypothetical protein
MSLNNKVANLLTLAEQFESEGKLDHAASLYATAAKMVEEEEEKEEKDVKGGMSGKQKAALRALLSTCERVTKVMGDRIPRRVKKIDDKCEEIIELMKSIDLD